MTLGVKKFVMEELLAVWLTSHALYYKIPYLGEDPRGFSGALRIKMSGLRVNCNCEVNFIPLTKDCGVFKPLNTVFQKTFTKTGCNDNYNFSLTI